MKRGLLTRRIAAVILLSFTTLTIAVFAPLFYGLSIEDATRLGTGVFASQADTISITRPVRLSTAPDIVLTTATLVAVPAPPGQRRAVKLIAPVFTVTLGAAVSTSPPSVTEALHVLAPLADQFAGNVEAVTLQGGTIDVTWGAGDALTLTGIDAQIQLRGAANLAAKGQFEYRGQTVAFDMATAPMVQPLAVGPDLVVLQAPSITQSRTKIWPLRLSLTSAPLDVTLEGALNADETPKLTGVVLVSTPDAAKAARWLGHGWRGRGATTAVRINGPLHWAEGTLTLGKSVMSLNDQTGAGALSLSFRETRPLIEASLAFPALDVAPFMVAEPATIVPAALLKMAGSAALQSPKAWRSLVTSFPSLSSIDVDWRLSAEHLQWQGEPVGSMAVSVTARDGKLSADFAELEVGRHKGTLQITADGQTAGSLLNPPTTIRGKFLSTDVGPVFAEFLSANILSGIATSQFEITGAGATLGELIQAANGHGSFESADGTMPVDLAALQSMARGAPLETPSGGWSAILGRSPYTGLAAKWLLRDGLFVVDQLQVQSQGLLATMQGQIGPAPKELDLVVRVTPAAGGSVARGGSPRSYIQLNRLSAVTRDSMTIRGPKDRPIFSTLDMDRSP